MKVLLGTYNPLYNYLGIISFLQLFSLVLASHPLVVEDSCLSYPLSRNSVVLSSALPFLLALLQKKVTILKERLVQLMFS